MEKSGEQMMKRESEKNNKLGKLERLPVERSPYTQYQDLEDYKRQGYGAEGHQEPKTARGAGSTDAPTLSGAAVLEAKLFPTNVINRHGVS